MLGSATQPGPPPSQKVDSGQFYNLSQFKMNLQTYAEKSQGKKFSHLLDEARRHVTPGAVGMHLGE